jgi:hypothetical protein
VRRGKVSDLPREPRRKQRRTDTIVGLLVTLLILLGIAFVARLFLGLLAEDLDLDLGILLLILLVLGVELEDVCE